MAYFYRFMWTGEWFIGNGCWISRKSICDRSRSLA